MTRIPVDLNNVSADGYYRVRLSYFKSIPKVNDPVHVFEDQDRIEGIARVAEVTLNFVYVDINWDTMEEY